ncbi:MAG: GNAT family N-acetyltransferase [Candidatus Bathyarchaeota archaeon]|nr:GNAT family N-acetyltransferase [Candidatus Bathyarchaeota archaeon]
MSLNKRLVYSFLVFEMIEGERVRMRSFELSDLDEIMKHWNNMELRNLVGSADRGPVARSEEEEWIRNTWKQRQERKAFTFAIETTADNRLIGGTGLFNIDWTSRSAMVGISIYNPEYWGKGYGQESTNLILGFAFRNLNLNRVELETFDFNKRAQKCYLNVGFKEVGRRRKACLIDGQYHDDIIMDILKDEWLAKSKKKQP